MDWKLCILCQTKTREALQCPALSKRKDIGASYCSFARNIEEFQKIGAIPLNVNAENLDDGQGIENTLYSRKAVWHKSCRNAFSDAKLKRARKRKLQNQETMKESEDPFMTEKFTCSPVKRRSSSISSTNPSNQCFFCELSDSSDKLHLATTLQVNEKVKACASLVNDNKLLAKLALGDMVATDAKYHLRCLVSLYNKVRKQKTSSESTMACSSSCEHIDGNELAFAELVAFIDESIQNDEPAVLKLSDLVKFYTLKVSELAGESAKVNSTRLKSRILAAFPDLTAHNEGREVFLILGHEIGSVLLKANNTDSDAICLAKAAMIVRKEILNTNNSFNGTFAPESQKESVPATLTALLNMIMRGPTIKTDPTENQACLTVSQLLAFNTVSRFRNTSGSTTQRTHHARKRECPLPIYLALKIRGATREKSLVDTFYRLGMCISYDRLLLISTDITNSVIQRYDKDGVVCPSKLHDGIFTTAALDNIDHNPSSTSAYDSFHGTAISLAQHPTHENPGRQRCVEVLDPSRSAKSKKIATLPAYYTDIVPLTLHSTNIVVPDTSTQFINEHTSASNENYREEEDWLKNTKQVLEKTELATEDTVSWAAYRASKATPSTHQPALISLLPMFTDNAHSPAMIVHGISIVSASIKHLNPSQIPVIVVDQPLFALAKEIQWKVRGVYDEDHVVVMLGGLHIEMAALKALGRWVHGSGWVEALVNASVASSGVADSFLSASHVMRTRRAHQVTAVSLYILMNKTYEEYCKSKENERPVLPFHLWRDEQMKKSPQFLYWATTLDFEVLCFQLVRAFREANFCLYLRVIRKLLPWMFALDSHNYARWLSVHYRDMCELSHKHPDVYAEFSKGSFVVHKTKKLFSSIALDHAHEQVNAVVKGEGGAVGLTENPAALRRWMVSGPELSRMICEFEVTSSHESSKHHEQTPSIQATFAKDVINLVSSIEELGNPFNESGEDLTILHTKEIMNEETVNTVRNAREIGEQQLQAFLKERFIDKAKPLTDPIKKNKFPTFNNGRNVVSKEKAKVAVLKEDCALFSRLYIACQNRDGNLDEFFKFENQPWPPSLSQMGQLRQGNKADLVTCLIDACSQTMEQPCQVDAAILDGALLSRCFSPKP